MAESINPRKLAQGILFRIFTEYHFADLLLAEAFQKYDLSKDERQLVAELVYGILCWQGKIDWILEHVYTGDWLTLPQSVKRTMEVGAYQILFMDDIPNEIAVKEAVAVSVQDKGMVWARVVNFVLLEIQRKLNRMSFPDMKEDPVLAIATLWSYPKWVIEKWISYFGIERTLSICVATNQKHHVSIRINPIKVTQEELIQKLTEDNIEIKSSGKLSEFFETENLGDILTSQAYSEGLFSIQDISSGYIGHLMDPQPEDVILDQTAAPGQKALHLSELSNNAATILAVDRHPNRIKMLHQNKMNYGAENIVPILADGIKPPVNRVSKILLDPSCSSLGAVGHMGELKWRRKANDLNKLVKLQLGLLNAAANHLITDGFIVYTVSTLMPEETNEIIHKFLETHQDFRIEKPDVPDEFITTEGYMQIWPDLHGMDAIFAAKLRKD